MVLGLAALLSPLARGAWALEPPPSPEVEALSARAEATGDPRDRAALAAVRAAERRLATLDLWAIDVLERRHTPSRREMGRVLARYGRLIEERAGTVLAHADRLYPPRLLPGGEPPPAQAPEVVDIHDPRFSPVNRRLGQANPQEWLARVRGGILALTPPDASRPILLFVHGSGGSPDDFDDCIARLDPARAQVWVAYYPSGLPIARSAEWLAGRLACARAAVGAGRIHVVGHSLGGLVVRQMRKTPAGMRALAGLETVTFVSTPHLGVTFGPEVPFRLVAYLVGRWLPASSREILVGSRFLRALNASPDPIGAAWAVAGDTPRHAHLKVFSRLIPGVDDGYVRIASARYTAAVENRVLSEDHITIPRSAGLAGLLAGLIGR